jgi:chemotaxis signal transduction protein
MDRQRSTQASGLHAVTSPRFRSSAVFAQRSRGEVALVDWATFVVFALGGTPWAVPVEGVERVLRVVRDGGDAPATIAHRGRQIPVFELGHAVRSARHTNPPTWSPPVGAPTSDAMHEGRWLILALYDGWVACLVEDVREVVTIDAATVRAVPLDDPRQIPEAGVRGAFTRREQEVLVLDMARLVRATHGGTRHGDV